jgi:hypothetical protein
MAASEGRGCGEDLGLDQVDERADGSAVQEVDGVALVENVEIVAGDGVAGDVSPAGLRSYSTSRPASSSSSSAEVTDAM